MSSTYSQNLKLELIGDGEQSGIWGDTTNYNLGTLLEQAITGIQSITVGGSDVTLTNYDGLSNQARNAVLYVTGTPGAVRTIFIPSGQSKTYIVYNGISGGYSLNVYVTGQTTGVTIPSGATILMYTNGANCFLVSPTTASAPTINTFTGYVTGTQLNVTSGTVVKDQVIYNPGFITSGNPNGYATISAGTSTPYTIAYSGTSVIIGDATYAPNQPFVAITTPSQLVTLDYVQNKTQSMYLGGTPTAPTATASVFEGYISGSVLIVTSLYPGGGGISAGYYLNGTNITAGSYVQTNGTGTTGTSVFTGYISAGAGLSTAGTTLTITGISSGTPSVGQYIDGGATAVGTRLASGSGLSWGVSGSAQLIGSPSNPVVFRGIGAGTGGTGWYTLNTASSGVTVTPIVAYYQPTQLANMTMFSYVSYLVGSLGTQDYNSVNITGGSITGITPLLANVGGTGASSLTPNAVMVGGGTGAVTTIQSGSANNVLSASVGSPVTSGSFVVGTQYSITTVGTTDFTLIGATATSLTTSTIVGTILTVGAGTPVVGQILSGTGVTANTTIVAQLTATTWQVSTSQTVASTTITATNPVFTATGVGTGTGTASPTVWVSSTPSTTITTTSGVPPYFGARAFISFSMLSNSDVTGVSAVLASGTVTLTISGTHKYQVGHYVTLTGSTNVGTFVVTAVTANTISYTAAALPTGVLTIRQWAMYESSGTNVANVAAYNSSATGTTPTAGIFIVNFIQAMPYVNYTVFGSNGTSNGGTFAAGEDDNVVFGYTGYTGIRTTQSIRGFVENAAASTLENSSMISVMVMA